MIEHSFVKIFIHLVHIHLPSTVFINPYTISIKDQHMTLELTTLQQGKNYIKQFKMDVESLLADPSSLETARNEAKEWPTNLNFLWSQYQLLAEINVYMGKKKGIKNIYDYSRTQSSSIF